MSRTPFAVPFQFSLAVSEADAFVSRQQVFSDVMTHVQLHEYVSVLAPRQTGKTTFLAELRDHLIDCVYVDFSTRKCSDLRDVIEVLGSCTGAVGIGNGYLDGFLNDLMASRRVTFLIDDICRMKPVAVEFLRALRAYHGVSVVERRPFHEFIFADTIDPLDLTLRDSRDLSPFNIAHKFYLDDFRREEVREFLAKRAGEAFAATCSDRVFEDTHGHPFLVQFLSSYLHRQAATGILREIGDLETLVDRSGVERSSNVECLVSHVRARHGESGPETAVLAQILNGARVPFTLLDPTVKNLYLEYGCIRSDQGFCAIRNRIYQLLLERNCGRLVQSERPPKPRRPKAKSLRSVYVSYAGTTESTAVAREMCEALLERDIDVRRDRDVVRYRDSIREFMKNMGRGSCIIILLSRDYLESKYCMFELTEIAARGSVRKRVFPIFLEDARIFEAATILEHLDYWSRKREDLQSRIKKMSDLQNIKAVWEELDLFATIRATISDIAQILADMNALSLEEHRATSFRDLARALEERLSK